MNRNRQHRHDEPPRLHTCDACGRIPETQEETDYARGRRDGLREAAERYHGALARFWETEARCALPGVAEDLRAKAKKHREYRQAILDEVWMQPAHEADDR